MNPLLLKIALIPFSILLFFVELRYRPNRVLVGSLSKVEKTSGHWEKAAPVPSFRYEFATAAIGDDVYAVGGIILPSVWFPTNMTEVYNASSDSWKTVAPYPVVVHHAAAAAIEGKLYVAGGNGVRIMPRNDLFMYDPALDTWTRKADLPVARGALGVTALDGLLYVVGGGINKIPVNFLHIYDPKTDSWREGKPMPTAREHVTAVAAAGKIYVLGGYEGVRFNNLKSNEVYDPKTDTWETLAPLPYVVSGFTAVAMGDSIFMFGGEQGWAVSKEVHEYNIRENTWVRHEDLPVGRYALTSAVVDGKIHVLGGNTYIMGNDPSAEHDVFVLSSSRP